MRKFTAVTLLLLFIITLPVSAAQINGSGKVNADNLNVRATPDMNGAILGKLPDNANVNIITKTGEWFEISFGGSIGYVHSDYLAASRREVKEVVIPTIPQSASGEEKAQLLVDYAMEFLGVPYVWGGTSPSGFDCSGLVYYVYGKFDEKLYRVACDMLKNGTAVSFDDMKPGDIVLFWNQERYQSINHVGIYVGDGNFIHAPQTGDVVKITTLESGYYQKTLYAVRRIFN